MVLRHPDGDYTITAMYSVPDDAWYLELDLVANQQDVPQHGLDLSLGTAALYTVVPAWHTLGNVIPGGTSDIGKVLELDGIDYQVESVPAQYPWNDETRVDATMHHTVRTDTGASLGVVRSGYEIIQNRRAFEFPSQPPSGTCATWAISRNAP